MTRWLGPAGVSILVVALVVWSVLARPPAPGVIPPALADQATAHQIQTAIDADSLRELQAAHDAAVARAARRQAIDSMRQVVAGQLGRQADSLAAVARAAATARDSADAWQAAYLERTGERDSLAAVVASRDSTIADLDSARVWALTGQAIERAGRERAERGWEAALREVARRPEPCTIGPLPCPSRTVVGLVSFATGVAASR